MNKRLTIAFIIICSVYQANAQPNIKDSLQQLLRSRINGSKKVDVLNQLAYQYFDFNDSIARDYANQAVKLSKELSYKKGLKYAYTLVGLGYFAQSKFKEAIHYFQLSEGIKVKNSESNAIYNLTLMGTCYRDMAFYDSALLFYNNAKRIKTDSSDFKLTLIYKNLAILKILQWDNLVALKMADSASYFLTLENTKNNYIQLDLWSIYGQAYKNILQFDSSHYYNKKMCGESENLEDYYHQIMCLLNSANLEYEISNYANALKLCFRALNISKNYVYPPQYVRLLTQIGEIYSDLSQYDIASQYFHKALKRSEELGLRSESATIYAQLAWIDKDLGHYESAIDYCNKSFKLRTEIGDRKGVANCYNIYSLINLLKKEYSKSLEQQERALKIRKEINYTEGISASIFNISLVYEELNQLDKAIQFQQDAIIVEEKTKNKQSLAISYNSLARLLVKKNRFVEASDYLIKAKKLAEITGSYLIKLNNAIEFAYYFEAIHDYKKALEYHKIAKQWGDSVYSEKSLIKLAESEAMYNLELKEKDIALLKQTKKVQENQLLLQQSQLDRKNFIIYISCIGIILLIGASFFSLRMYTEKLKINRALKEQQEEVQAQSEELQEANQQIASINKNLEDKVEVRTAELRQAYKELDTFFYRSSHDFRRPITTFLGLTEVAKITVKDTLSLELFEKVEETALSLDKMIQKLQSISDVGALQLLLKDVFFNDQVNDIIDTLKYQIIQKKISITKEITEKEPFVSYPAMVKIILENLIENAIYFSRPDNAFIYIKIFANSQNAVISIEDNGQGILDEYKERIFEMYFRGNEHSKGNGLGLYIAKKAVEKLQGKINYISKHGEGSIFKVELPNLT